jgi:hypothetical protein
MMLVLPIIFFLYKVETGESVVGHRQERRRKREREKQIKGVGGRV